MKKILALSLTMTFLTAGTVYADINNGNEECDPEEQDCSEESDAKEPLKTIYPFKPLSTEEIHSKIAKMTENDDYVGNIFELERRNLRRANAKIQPWGASFWPLFQGMVANTYQNKDSKFFITTLLENLSWKENVSDFKKRKEKVLPMVYSLDEKELAKLAPSEKYDLLLGDTSFDLTNKVWKYVENWGRGKQWNKDHVVSINFNEVAEKGFNPDHYRAPKGSSLMAFWEGICHGWTLASMLAPRPEKSVVFTLPNGKRMPIYSSDIKAIISLAFANSDVQDYVNLEGNKCNKKNPDKDKFGRYIDVKKDLFLDRDSDADPTPRCADVHPAVYHVSVMNILGIEGRSYVMDHNPKAPVANQPVSGYEYTYYNLQTGKEGTLQQSMIPLNTFAKDPYKVSRNPEAKYVVGVNMVAKFVDWELPKKQITSSPKDDKIKDQKFRYDLEIDANGEIVGGQWIASGSGTNQPDYFYVAPKDWKKFFQDSPDLPEWNQGLPPVEYKERVLTDLNLHSFVRYENRECPIYAVEGEGPMIKVSCRHKFARPRPLMQVVRQLIRLSSGKEL